MENINYCDKCGNCSRCGECCAATLPITKTEEKKIKEYISKNNIEPEFFKMMKVLICNAASTIEQIKCVRYMK